MRDHRTEIEKLLDIWKPKIRILIKKYAFGISDKELLFNELLEKVYICSTKFDPDRNVKFETFTNKCLLNHLQVALRREKRRKHSFITDSISLDQKDDNGLSVEDLIEDRTINVDNSVMLEFQTQEIISYLPEICKTILILTYEGHKPREIAKTLNEKTIFIKCVIEKVLRPLFEKELGVKIPK